MLYTEEKQAGNKYREKYLKSIEELIENREKEAESARHKITKAIVSEPEKHREKFAQMLGWPLTGNADRAFEAVEEFVAEDELCRIYRVTLKLKIGVEAYGILMLPNGVKNPRISIVQHGGAGCPELLIGLYRQTNYNDMPRRILRRGVAVYMPQMLLWNSDDLECAEFNRECIDGKLKQLGSSITALEIFKLFTAIDYLHGRKDLNCTDFTMVGLSYGGFYTLFTAALDLRIKRAYSSCFFNDRMVHSRPDWSWFNAAYTYFDAQVAAMIAPRRLYIEVADKDEVFSPEGAKKIATEVEEVYNEYGCSDEFVFNVFSGYHEFSKTDEGIDFVIK